MANSKSFRYKINISPILDKAWRIRVIQCPRWFFLFPCPTNTAAIGNKLKWIYCKRRDGKKATFTGALFSCDFFLQLQHARFFLAITKERHYEIMSVCRCVGVLMNYWYTFTSARVVACRSYQPKYNLHMVDYITVECGWYVEMWSKEIHTKKSFLCIL
jgi:hypothetical protein